MTLNELHEQLENIQRAMTDDRDLYSDVEIEFNGELIKAIEELKLYKKAFELACWDLDNYTDTFYITLMNEYLQKARKENDT